MSMARLLPLALALAASTAAWAADDIRCPAQLQIGPAEISVPALLPRWTPGQSARPVWLSGIALYDGPPGEQAQLVPDQRTSTPSLDTALWHLASPYPAWVRCQYAGGLFHLDTPVTGQPHSCSASVKKLGDGRGVEIEVSCGN